MRGAELAPNSVLPADLMRPVRITGPMDLAYESPNGYLAETGAGAGEPESGYPPLPLPRRNRRRTSRNRLTRSRRYDARSARNRSSPSVRRP